MPLDSVKLLMSEVARDVYGARAEWDNSSLTAFCYCYRRFGPPPRGTDDYKQLGGAWLLKTRDPDVYLDIDPGGCSIDLYFGQYVSMRLRKAADKPGEEWRAESYRRYCEMVRPGATWEDWLGASMDGEDHWEEGMPPFPRCPPEIEDRVLGAIRHVLLDLLRPVYVRDAPINLFGRISDDNPGRGRTAERSHMAGWGVNVREIERRVAERQARLKAGYPGALA